MMSMFVTAAPLSNEPFAIGKNDKINMDTNQFRSIRANSHNVGMDVNAYRLGFGRKRKLDAHVFHLGFGKRELDGRNYYMGLG